MACQKEGGRQGSSNQLPIAQAGLGITILFDPQLNAAPPVVLDASTSTDPDGFIVSHAWSGPGQIIQRDSARTAVHHLVPGKHVFYVQVTDNKGATDKDSMTVEVLASAGRPTVQAKLIPFGKLSQARAKLTAIAAGNRLLFAGGYTQAFSSRIDIYDRQTMQWSQHELTTPRAQPSAALAGNMLLITGGREREPWEYDTLHKNVDVFNAATGTWTVHYLSMAREYIAAAAVGNRAYIAGGNNSSQFPDLVDVFDASSGTWSAMSMGTVIGRSRMSAVVAGGKIYFGGGTQHYPAVTSGRLDIYDAATGGWQTGVLKETKDEHAAIAFQDRIFWAGGLTHSPYMQEYMSSLVEIRDLSTQTTSFAGLSQPNSHFSAVEQDGKIVFFTGRGGSGKHFDIYDTQTGEWQVGILPVTIRDAAIISVNNIIYVAGGEVNGSLSDDVYMLLF